jgi:hypothetical protein
VRGETFKRELNPEREMSAKLPPSAMDEKAEKKVPLLPCYTTNASFEFSDKMLEEEHFDEVYRKFPLTEETMCGIGALRGRIMQK